MSHMAFATADHGEAGLLTFKESASCARLVSIQKRAPLRHGAATGPQAALASATTTGDQAVRQLPEQSSADRNARRCD